MSFYGTQQEAQTYFASLLHRELWANTPLQTRAQALTSATQRVDLFDYKGEKQEDDQDLKWPRTIDDEDVFPTAIKHATYEIAYALLDGADPDEEIEKLAQSSFAFANVRQDYDRNHLPEHLLAGVPSSVAWAKLRPYLIDPRSYEIVQV